METYSNEAGGHRWQRVPPNEKRGRVHTSTVTVAVLNLSASPEFRLNERELEITTCRSSGKGGQGVNTTNSCVIVKHRPSGVTIRIQNERSQNQNRAIALETLRARLAESTVLGEERAQNQVRREQVGSGMRGDKIRTYREQDDIMIDHRIGKKCNLQTWRNGEWK